MKTDTYLINFRKYFFLIFILSLTTAFSQQDLRDCGYNCTTNAFSIESVFLSATNVPGTPLTNTSCESGTSQQVYMIAEISSNRNSAVYHGRIFADLMVGGSTITINEYLGTLPSSNSGLTQRLVYGPFNWTCGELLTLENVLVVWKTSQNNGPDENDPYNCGSYSSSQCQFPSDLIVSTPLAVQYDYTACTDNNGIATVNFESTTIGGTPPYSYTWNYDGGTLVGGTASSPIVEYDINGGPYNPTLTVTDSNGNVNLYPYSVTLSFPSILVNSLSFTSAQCTASDGTATFTASGGTPPYTFTVNSNTTGGSTFVNGPPSTELLLINAGAGSISVTITDSAGCEAEEAIVMIAGDSDDPQITAPQDYSVEGCDTSILINLPYSETPVNITLTQLQNALDGGGNASDDGGINQITYEDIATGSCPIQVIRLFTVTDNCGKSASDTQSITINTPALSISEADGSNTVDCLSDATETFTLPTITDACGNTLTPSVAVITDSPDPLTCEGTRTYTYTYTDCNNIQDTWSFEYTIDFIDLAPIAETTDTVDCVANIVVPTPPSIADNCGNDITPSGPVVSAAPACEGEITYTWTYTDCAGSSQDYVHRVTIDFIDLAPIAETTDTVDCVANIVVPTPPSIADNCGNDITPSGPVVSAAPACEGEITYTWTYTDCAGSSQDYVHRVTIEIEPFIINTPNGSSTVACASLAIEPVPPTVLDNCGNTITPSDPVLGGDFVDCEGTISYTWTYSDCEGNSLDWTYTYSVQLEDIQLPPNEGALVNCFADADVNLINPPVINDSCGLPITPIGPTQGGTYVDCEGTITFTYVYPSCQGSNNEWVYTYTIEIVEFVLPNNDGSQVTCIDDAQIVPTPPVVIDNCNNTIVPSGPVVSPDPTCIGDKTYTWTYTDCTGYSLDWVYTYSVNDNIAPTITTVAADQTVLCDGNGNTQEYQAWLDLHAGANAVDNCSSVDWTYEVLSTVDQCGATSRTLVRFIATDACNNSSTTTALFTILDLIPPTIDTEAADLTVQCDGAGNLNELNNWLATNGGASASDLCGNVNWSNNFSGLSDDCGETGSATVTFTAMDDCDNPITTTATFTIIDTVAPLAPSAPADIAYECIADVPAPGDLTATDNCAGDITVTGTDATDSSDPCNIIITRTWTFTDSCDNSSSVSQTITVADTTAPVAPSAPADIAYECIADVPAPGDLTATDNCAGDITVTGTDATDSSDPCNIIITRTWTFTDSCDNSSSVSQTITVADTTAPVAPSAPADIAYECIADVPAPGDLTATDNCAGDITVTGTDATDSSDPCNIIITRTWTFTDSCDNSSSVSQTITVADTTAPVVTNDLSDITVNCDVIPDAPMLVFDDCSNDVTITDFNEDNSFDGTNNDYEIIWTWEFTDSCGNIGTASQIVYVTIVDTITYESDSRCSDDGTIDLFDYYFGSDMSGTWEVVSGNTTLDDNYFDPSDVELGDYIFSYSVAENGCIITTEVTININDDCIVLPCGSENVNISKAVTPNGDQWNEYFEVTGVEDCGFVLDVKIFNRWGAMIYESSNYQNNWNGTASKASIGNADKIPNGTYYYILTLKNSGLKPFTGYIYVGTK